MMDNTNHYEVHCFSYRCQIKYYFVFTDVILMSVDNTAFYFSFNYLEILRFLFINFTKWNQSRVFLEFSRIFLEHETCVRSIQNKMGLGAWAPFLFLIFEDPHSHLFILWFIWSYFQVNNHSNNTDIQTSSFFNHWVIFGSYHKNF